MKSLCSDEDYEPKRYRLKGDQAKIDAVMTEAGFRRREDRYGIIYFESTDKVTEFDRLKMRMAASRDGFTIEEYIPKS